LELIIIYINYQAWLSRGAEKLFGSYHQITYPAVNHIILDYMLDSLHSFI